MFKKIPSRISLKNHAKTKIEEKILNDFNNLQDNGGAEGCDYTSFKTQK